MVSPKRSFPLLLCLGGLSLLPVTVIPLHPAPVQAGTCASHCGPAPLQFTPGSYITVEWVNLTANVVEVQESEGSDPIPLAPGRSLQLYRLVTTRENSSLVFWDTLGLALKAQLSKPEPDLLRVELVSSYEPPGDRSLYLRDNGQVDTF